jgi:hypothetical protein
MTRLRRILTVTAGLVAVGATVGALAGAAVAALIGAILDAPLAALDPELLLAGATFGAPLGAVLLPVAGWLLMRHVPLGRALVWTTVGTVAGGLVGWFLPASVQRFMLGKTLVGGIIGFLLAVLILRRSASAARGKRVDVSAA